VGTQDRDYARTVTRWFLYGTVGMFVVVTIPALGTSDPVAFALTNEAISAGVVGGGVGGILVGTRTATANRQRDQLERQADQSVLVNRLLRHEVLNAMTAIRGHAGLLSEGRETENSWSVVETNADRITRTIEDVGFIVRTGGDTAASLGEVELPAIVQDARSRLDHPDAVDVDAIPSVTIRADTHLATAIEEVIRAAVERSEGTPRVSFETTGEAATVEVVAPGRLLSESEHGALTDSLPEYDTPDVGYGFSIVNLLVAQYEGDVAATVSDDETAISLSLPRTSSDARESEEPGIGPHELRQASVAGIVAGVGMGVLFQTLSGSIGIIGALYGSPTPAVGWITHLFHSVVFATAFTALVAHPRVTPRADSPGSVTALAVAFGVLLWLVAAGVVMGVWLNAVGIQAAIPNLTPAALFGHVAWGVLLGAVTWTYPGVDHDR
jgi:signal transduction histidine kinase